jgi:predicted neuraminidase
MPDELDEDTWEHAAVPNADTNVSGCSDSSRPELWVDHCSAFYDGKLYARGGATTAAMMKRLSRGTHAASLLELPDGTLLFAWFSGTSGEREGLAGVVIVLARLALGAQEWSEPVIVSAHEGRSNQNPVLFRDPATGFVWLFHTSQAGGQGQGTAFVASIHSMDGGLTWSAPKQYTNFPDAGPFVKVSTGHEWP